MNALRRLRGMAPRLVVFAIALLGAIMAAWAVGKARGDRPDADTGSAGYATVTRRPMAAEITLVGRILPSRSAAMVAPFDATIRARHASFGQQVEAGTTVFELDTAAIDTQLAEARAARLRATSSVRLLEGWETGAEVARARRTLRETETAVEDIRRQLTDVKVLLERGIVARLEHDALARQLAAREADLEAARLDLRALLEKGSGEDLEIARLELAGAEARYAELERRRALAHVRAPVAGVLLPPPSTEGLGVPEPDAGVAVRQGQALASLADTNSLTVRANVAELDVNRIHPGQRATVAGPGFPGALTGTVSLVAGQAAPVDGQVGLFEVEIRLEPLHAELASQVRVGMTAEATIRVAVDETALVVPVAAIGGTAIDPVVRVIDAVDGSVRTVPVRLGIVDVQWAQVLSGVGEGTRVLLP